MKKVILGNDEYFYKVNENGEETLIRDEIKVYYKYIK